MALTNPTKLINVQELSYFEGKLAAKYQTKSITAITGLTSETVEGALAELLGKIQAIPSAIIPKGTRTFSQLAPSTDLAESSLGNMWNISDAFTTTSDFVEGSGHPVAAGSNVYVVNAGTAQSPSYKYDIFAGPIDLSDYKTTQEAVNDPAAGSATDTVNFIATISQNANGEITATKQPVRSASASQSGLMSSAHYSKLDAIAYAADSDIDEIFADSGSSE